MSLRVCTYNIHKGFSHFNRRMVVHDVRRHLRSLEPDIVFLQEVQGAHQRHELRHVDWPGPPQHEFLAEDTWPQTAYGQNAVYGHGHHGNAILTHLPILSSTNQDVSDHRFERRGLLHCELSLSGHALPLHIICVHLGLIAGSRQRQMDALACRIEQRVAAGSPLIIAGDFNDWRNHADDQLMSRLGLSEAFTVLRGRPARTFPSHMPMLRLDRIYLRGFDVRTAQVHAGLPWSRLSDHAPLTADIDLVA